MTKSRLIPAALASLLAVGALGAIFTQTANAQAAKIEQTDPSEFPMIDGAKVSLAEAIATAEKEFGGKAAAAGIDDCDRRTESIGRRCHGQGGCHG